MGKNLPEVGDVSVTATVCAKSAKALSSVRLGLVYNLAQKIAAAMKACCREKNAAAYFRTCLKQTGSDNI